MKRDGAALPAGRGQEGPRSRESGTGKRRATRPCHQRSGNSEHKGRGGHLNGEQHELKVEAVWIVVP